MITVLLLALLGCVVIQPNAQRLFACVVFVGVTCAHELFLSNTTGLFYYGSAALFDLSIIILTSGIYPVPAMVVRLQQLCLVSIIANFSGWLLWALYYPPALYDLAFVAIYLYAAVLMLNRGDDDVGGFTMDSWFSCLRFYDRARDRYLSKNRGQT